MGPRPARDATTARPRTAPRRGAPRGPWRRVRMRRSSAIPLHPGQDAAGGVDDFSSKIRVRAQSLGLVAGDFVGEFLAHALDAGIAGDVEPGHDVEQRPNVLDQTVAERVDTVSGDRIDLKGAETLDQTARDLLYPLPQVTVGVLHQLGVARLDLRPDLRHLGVAKPHPEIIGLRNRHEVS